MTRLQLKTLVTEMTGTPFHELSPGLIDYLQRAQSLYTRAGGTTGSRQIVALGIATWEQMQELSMRKEDYHHPLG